MFTNRFSLLSKRGVLKAVGRSYSSINDIALVRNQMILGNNSALRALTYLNTSSSIRCVGLQVRLFSETSKKSEDNSHSEKSSNDKASEEAAKDNADESKSSSSTKDDEIPHVEMSLFDKISNFIKQGIDELSGKDKESVMTRQVVQAESYQAPKKKSEGEEGADEDEEDKEKYDGPSAMVVVKNAKSPWEAMKARLEASTVYREFMKRGKKVREAAVETEIGKKAAEKIGGIRDKLDDVREIWETSQNPVIYFVSGAVSSVTAPTEESIAIQGFQRLDPNFEKEVFLKEAREQLFPMLLKSVLIGDYKTLKPWCSEMVYRKLSTEIKLRKQDGYVFDATVLDVEDVESEFLTLEDGTPTIKVTYVAQLINLIKNREGEIVEGGPNDIRNKYWILLFQQEYDEDTSVVKWKVVELALAGDLPAFV